MRVTRPSPTVLIVSDAALAVRAIGVAFAASGGALVWLIGTERIARQGAIFPGAMSALFVAIGLALVVLPRASTYVFDKASRTLYVTRRLLIGRPSTELIALRDVASVELQHSAASSGTGNGTYRIAFVMADGRREPWTSYYSSGLAGKLEAVEAVRTFLSLPAARERPTVGASMTSNLSPAGERAAGCLLKGMAAFCLLFVGAGAVAFWTEQRKLATYQSVAVTVLGADVEECSGGDDGPTYRPVVSYRYEVGGRSYQSSRVTPLNESGGYKWARTLADRFAAGGAYTGWYDPKRPEESFLVRRRSVIPYAFIGIPGIGLLILVLVAKQTRERRAFSG